PRVVRQSIYNDHSRKTLTKSMKTWAFFQQAARLGYIQKLWWLQNFEQAKCFQINTLARSVDGTRVCARSATRPISLKRLSVILQKEDGWRAALGISLRSCARCFW